MSPTASMTPADAHAQATAEALKAAQPSWLGDPNGYMGAANYVEVPSAAQPSPGAPLSESGPGSRMDVASINRGGGVGVLQPGQSVVGKSLLEGDNVTITEDPETGEITIGTAATLSLPSGSDVGAFRLVKIDGVLSWREEKVLEFINVLQDGSTKTVNKVQVLILQDDGEFTG